MSQHGFQTETKFAASNTSITALVPIWDSGEQTLLLAQDRTFRAGRGRDCDLLIAHPGVAEWHATVIQNGRQVTVRPEQGQHVWINDQLIDRAAPIEFGDTLAIGPATFRVESRRSGRRAIPPAAEIASSVAPDLSARLEQQLNELQQEYSAALRDPATSASSSGHGFGSFAPSFSAPNAQLPPQITGPTSAANQTPFMDFAATTNRRSALDERETQLNEWHRSLDRRREELDKRSANLTRQQAALTARQTLLDQRTAELESWHQSALEDIEDRKASVNSVASTELMELREELKRQEQQLQEEQQQVAEQLSRMEDSRQSIANQLQTLEDARGSLKAEQAELAEERSRLEQETQARKQADSEQEEAFRLQREKLDRFADQLEGEREALHQQEASLRDQQTQLETRSSEVIEAEERIQLASEAAEASAVSDELAQTGLEQCDTPSPTVNSDTEAALLLLEEQKANLAEQQAAIQQQLETVQRKEDEVELIRKDVEVQRNLLSDEQVALEFERAEATTALDEALRLQQEAHDAQADCEADSDEADLSVSSAAESDGEAVFNDALVQREQELAERTQELANRLAELKSWKKQLEARELANEQTPAAAPEEPKKVERPKSVIASQLSSLLMPPGTISESDSLKDSSTTAEFTAIQQENETLTSETEELRKRVADLELQLQAAEQESTNLSSLLTQGDGPVAGRALTEQNLLAELQALKSELGDSQQAEENGAGNGDQVIVQSQIAELEARNQTIIDTHQQEVSKYEATINELNEQLGMVQKQFELLEERAMRAVSGSEQSDIADDEGESSNQQPEKANTADGEVQGVEDVDAQSDETVQKLSQMVEQLSEKLEQRNNTINNLQAQLNGGISVDASTSMTPQELNVLSQELDSRTVLLDERESAVRERERLLEQSEQELQTQRVALQEARQQLELARAEIHSAREPAASESMLLSQDLIDSVTELSEAGAAQPTAAPPVDEPVEVPEDDANQRSSVRSEIAELFGLGSKAKIEKPVEQPKQAAATAAELMEAVDDYSQESAAAVSLSFESAQDMLMAPDSEPAIDTDFDGESGDAPKDEADDVVASYMEQLLSRSRAKADGEAPPEPPKTVPNATVAKSPEPKKPAPEKKPAGQASFIEQYMAGAYNSERAPEPVEEAEVVETTSAGDQLAMDQSSELRRSKIDRDAQRNDLQSFRELSTKSAANALATHARRQQKGGITTRTTILTTLGLISVFVLSAAIIGVIPFGWFTTLSIVAVCVSGAELAWKMKKIQEEVTERTRLAGANSKEKVREDIPGVVLMDGVAARPSESTGTDIAGELNTAHDPNAPASEVVSADADNTVSNATQPLDETVTDAPVGQLSEVAKQAATASEQDVTSTSIPTAESSVGSEVPVTTDVANKVNPEVVAHENGVPDNTDSTSELLNSLALGKPTQAAEPHTEEAHSAADSETTASESSSSDDGGVPDAFDEAFRMLTSTSIPFKKPESEVEPTDDSPATES